MRCRPRAPGRFSGVASSMAVRNSSLDMTMSRTEVAVAVPHVAATGHMRHDRRDADDGPPGWLLSSMRGMPARIRAWPAETLKRKASLRKRGDVSSSGRGIVRHMLLTMMSRRPNSFHAVSAREALRSKCVRLPGTTMARRLAASICLATARSWSSVRAARTASVPALASATAAAVPMPRLTWRIGR